MLADSTTATVLVAIAESDEHQAEASVGFGTVECLRPVIWRHAAGGDRYAAEAGSARICRTDWTDTPNAFASEAASIPSLSVTVLKS